MLEEVLHASNGEDFFNKGFSTYGMGSVGNLPFIAVIGRSCNGLHITDA